MHLPPNAVLSRSPKTTERFYILGSFRQSLLFAAALRLLPKPPPVTILTPSNERIDFFYDNGDKDARDKQNVGKPVPSADLRMLSSHACMTTTLLKLQTLRPRIITRDDQMFWSLQFVAMNAVTASITGARNSDAIRYASFLGSQCARRICFCRLSS
ncbi:hypothetical protein BDZ45DRAFT_798378 [Acephala macrosclerotiorum]|nr:hypothetical protein BDZ45DRAFT_798378 [Acephala macrosclerotiorum]